MSWRKYLLVPKLIWYSRRASQNQQVAWDRFWASVRRTGPGGDVLWDAGSEYEIEDTVHRFSPHFDPSLPIVDAGCGNGRYTRALAAYFPLAVGIDVSPHAIERAREESRDVESVSFRVQDIGLPQVGRKLAAEFGDVNIYVRGVLHVLPPKQRQTLVQNLRDLLGTRGTLYLVETALKGDPLDHLEYQSATQGSIPDPLLKCIVNGVRPPVHFDESQFRMYFANEHWKTLDCGPTVLYTLPLHNRTGLG